MTRQPTRPAVPTDIARDVMIESGHRCAVCGNPCSLEKAHITPWSEVKEHTVENLICLCATCHTRSHDEKWDADTLREYKRRPWVTRAYENYVSSKPMVQVQLTIDALLRDFTDRDARILPLALAALLNIPPQDIRIRSVTPGSVNVLLDLPEESARELLRVHKRERRLLGKYLEPLKVLDLRLASSLEMPCSFAHKSAAHGREATTRAGDVFITTISGGELTGHSFAVEVSGLLTGGIEVNTGLIGALIQTIAQTISGRVNKVIIHFVEAQAEIRIMSDRAERVVRIEKFTDIAELYNRAVLEADSISHQSPEMKRKYLHMLRENCVQQFRELL